MTPESIKLKEEQLAHHKMSYGCLDCGADDQYMVTQAVWREAFPDYPTVAKERKERKLHTCLCPSCLESRLGRKLVITDFVDAPINRSIFFGFRMGLRGK